MHMFIENLLYAILMNVFIAIRNIKILLTWKLQCSEGRYIINMQKRSSIISGNIHKKRGLAHRKRCWGGWQVHEPGWIVMRIFLR